MNNIIQNLLNRLDQIFRAPFSPADRNLLVDAEVGLGRVFPINQPDLRCFQKETDAILDFLKADIDFPSTSDVTLICLTYAVIRLLRPAHVIETGVWIGSSSLTILSALTANGNPAGRLHSIDLPPVRAENRVNVGRVVPEELKRNWNLCLGSSADLLPGLVKSIPSVDLFIHDSDHTYRNIIFELRTIWHSLKEGGLIIVDDAHTNRASIDFAASVHREPVLVLRRKGGCIALIRK
jgi:predicted O-methyltransferase YrrM